MQKIQVGVSNNSGALHNMNANFNQSEWDATVKDNWNDYVKNNPNSGLSYGPEFKGAQWGENGLTMDANAPIMIPNLGKYGFQRGEWHLIQMVIKFTKVIKITVQLLLDCIYE